MPNGLGAGFFAITLLAVLAGLAFLVVLTGIVSAGWYRRRGKIPRLLRYIAVVVGAGVVVITGFGILVLSDEAPAAAGVFTLLVVMPFVVVGGYQIERPSDRAWRSLPRRS